MSKFFYALLGLLIVGNAFAVVGDTIYIDYDLQGGKNNPENLSSYLYSTRSDYPSIDFFPPTKDGADFLGWFFDSSPYDNKAITYTDPVISLTRPQKGRLSLYARWGVKAKIPQQNESGCMLVHDAAELYGAVKASDSLMRKNKQICVSIENDIVVNKNLLAADGSPNEGTHYWWKPFGNFMGVIEGNGHTISGLYGNVGLVNIAEGEYNALIQNLGIVDSYFAGDDYVGSFIANMLGFGISLKNVYSTATLDSRGRYVGGLVGHARAQQDYCSEYPLDAPIRKAPRAANTYDNNYNAVTVENAYFAGRLVGNRGSGLVGGTDFAVFKNTFFAGIAEAKKIFSAISQKGETQCQDFPNWKVVVENTFYLDSYTNEEFEANAASVTAFSDGTVLEKLVKGSSSPIWTQEVGKDAYPKLKGVYYDIAYDLAGGVNDSVNPSYYKPEQEVLLKPASKDGDVFEGWFADSNFVTPVEKILATDKGNKKFFAKWKNGYSITYVNDGSYSSVLNRNPVYRYADSATFVLKQPTKSGKTFVGWYSDSAFTTAVTELPTGNTEDIVLYAKWSAREIKISYNLVGGTMGDAKNPDKTLNGETITLKSPTREGYLFHGWLGTDGAILNEPGDFDRTYFVNSKNDEIEFKADWTYAPQKPETDADGCYLVTNVHELFYFDEIANSVLNEKPPIKACIKIMNDIVVNEDMNNANYIDWNPMNYENTFAGIIYGNGHTISGMYMNCKYFYNDNYKVFYGLIENKAYQQVYPEVQNLYLANFYFANEYYEKVLLNVNGKDGPGDGRSGIRKTIAPAPLKKKIAPKFDAKGRNMKMRPNYGVFF
jgi:uncharacterized repeat protein (TIGR02543 family)